MSPLSNPTTWRKKPYGSIGYLFILKPSPIFRARVNMTINDDTYPVANINYDNVTLGDYTDTQQGMTVLFGTSAGADDLGRNRLRQAANANRVRIGLSSRGRNDGEVDLVDDAYITVLDDFRLWWKPPRIEPDGTQYMDYRTAVDDYNVNTPPVAIAGIGYAGTNGSLNLSSSNSYATKTGGAIVSRVWDVKDGTITSGSTTTANIDVTFPPGFRWVKLTVTDNNAQTAFTRVPVYVEGEDSGQKTFTNFVVTNRRLSAEGHEISFLIREDIDLSEYPDGTLVMYWEDEFFGDTQTYLAGPTGRQHMKFIGYLQRERTRVGINAQVEITCVDIATRLRTIPGFPWIVANSTDPVGWSEMVGLNIDKYMHFILRWNTTALEIAPFFWSGQGTTYVAPALDSNAGTPWEQVAEIAEAICHKLVCDSRGQLKVIPDVNIIDTASRTSDETVTLTPDDYADMEYEYNREPRVGWLDAAAVKARSDKYKAILVQAPGAMPGQGSEQMNVNHRLVVNAAEFRIQEGNRYARANSRYSEFTFRLLNPGDGGIEPAAGEWLRIQINDFEGVRGRTIEARFIVKEVSWTYNHATGGRECRVTAEMETSGTPADRYFEPGDVAPPVDDDDLIFQPSDPIDTAQNVVVLFVANGSGFYRTTEWNLSSPTWQVFTGISIGGGLQFEEDPFSPYYTGTGNEINGWLLTETAIHRIEDIVGAFTVTTVHEFLDTGINLSLQGRAMAVSKLVPNHVAVIVGRNVTGTTGETYVAYTTDGITWTKTTSGLSSVNSQPNSAWKPGIWMSAREAGKVFIATRLGDITTGYFSTDYGATWTQIVPATHGLYLISDWNDFPDYSGNHIIIPGEDNENVAYFGRIDSSSVARLIRSNGNSTPYTTDITPLASSNRYGSDPTRNQSFQVSPLDADTIGIVGLNYTGTSVVSPDFITGNRGVWWSTDGGANWTEVVAPGAIGYRGCRVYGDNEMIVFGNSVIASAVDGILTDKLGNLLSLGGLTKNLRDVWRKR
jgi:hypothetical protein